MDRRQKPGGITISDLNNALAEARTVPKGKESRKYWQIRQQIAWEHRQKILEGMARARAKGKRVGRPPNTALGERIAEMRAGGALWREVCERFNMTLATAYRRYDRYLREKGLPGASRNRLK